MQIILTHEQADFDALASLFAASLLNERAKAVLPRRLNRNLRAFLTLYGREFSFIDSRDLSGEKIDSLLLVDTQSPVTLKGMGKWTRVRILDHHPPKKNLPADWQLKTEKIGATVTLLTENLRDARLPLSVLQATLLLLGIYEDTGSLSYTCTTPRDLRAAAWLLEQGASLNIAAEFLNPPLSPEQQKVYDELCANVETREINGHQIVIATADARRLEAEVSSLAHKLRDLLEPDALFILVAVKEGIRLVARSSIDCVSVGEIAAEFGGGGHPRAAAALIKEKKITENSVKNIKAALIRLLPRYIRPSVTVAEIMSRGPQVLSPETPVEEAAKLMQRFGYEGYPVVKQGRVVGLLNRRSVDRAIAHHLNLKTASLMEVGEVTVSPNDMLSTLQKRMTDSGWGQIPVVENGELIGIVTRTDLLKTLAPQTLHAAEKNLAAHLESALPPARLELIRKIAAVAEDRRIALYLVGGFVRDLLLNRPSLDFDIVVEGDAIALAHALAEKYGGRVTDHARFGTAKWFLKGASFQRSDLPTFLDFISARKEFYTYPSALPTVSRGSIKLDLHRRDFTINTLALRLDGRHYGELHDYWGGFADLRRGVVRVLHSLSFIDDPTRMLRAIRFEQRFDFKLGSRTQELISEAMPLLAKLSGQRIRHELDLILDEPRAVEIFTRLQALGLLEAISPALAPDPQLGMRLSAALDSPLPAALGKLPPIARLDKRRSLGYLAWLLPLSETNLRAVIKRLRLHAALASALIAAHRLWEDFPSLKQIRNSEKTLRLEKIPPLALYAVSLCASEEIQNRTVEQYLTEWRYIHPRTSGEDLKARGLKPSPRYGEILARLRAAWLDGEIKSEEEELQLLEELLKP